MKTQYVSNSVDLPENTTESQMLGQDLDGDGRPDNLLGQVLATLASQGADVQTQLDEAIRDGELVLLHELQGDDFTNWPTAGWQVFLGDDTGVTTTCDPMMPPADPNCPDFSGAGTFVVAADSPADAKMTGIIAGGQFSGGPTDLTIEITLVDGADTLQLDLIGGRVKADVTATGCNNGRLAGAITQDDINNKVLPAVADMLNTSIAADEGCGGVCPGTMCSDTTTTILELFDANMDCMISLMELQEDDLIQSILSPDVDLLDASGNYNPNSDGVEDSVSLGIGFTCVKASFTP